MTTSLRLVLIAASLTACNHDSSVGNEVDAAGSGIDGTLSDACQAGSERLVITGAYTLDTASAATVTRNGTVIGLNGQVAGKTYALGVRDALTQDLGTVGTFDVATTNIKHLEIPPQINCDTTQGLCKGFFALAGTFVVTSVQPRYHATFTLTDLRQRTTTSGAPGPAIAGTATGCIDAAP